MKGPGLASTNTIDQIKSNLKLSEVVGRDISLKRIGAELVGLCPFHSEKTGSFYVNDEKGTFYCFGCRASGDIFAYIQQKHGYTFWQALEYLASMAGITIVPLEQTSLSNANSISKNVLTSAAKFFQDCLQENKKVLEYCQQRHLSTDIIDKFKIGFAPDNNIRLTSFLKQKGFSEDQIYKSGLIKKENNYNFFRNRIMFPVFDKATTVIAFGGRAINNDLKPKYLNSAESEIFSKHKVLFNFWVARKKATDQNPFIVVEGYIDAISMSSFGFEATVATMGTSLSSDHLALLWQTCSHPIICFDGDEAGRKAMIRAALAALPLLSPGKSLKFCLLPNGFDPDSILIKNGKISMEEQLKSSQHLIDFLWSHFLSKFNSVHEKTPELIEKWKVETLSVIENIQAPGIKRSYSSNIKDKIFHLLRPKNIKTQQLSGDVQFIKMTNNVLLREALLLYTLTRFPSVVQNVVEKLAIVRFSDPRFSSLRDRMIEVYASGGGEDSDPCDTYFESSVALCAAVPGIGDFVPCSCFNDESSAENFWNDVFSVHLRDSADAKDIIEAVADCKASFDEKSWERLKALKVYSIKERLKDL